MQLSPKGRDWGQHVNWDDLGKLYAGILISWTVLLCGGIVWLVANRRLPFVRMRNVPLAICSVSFLHIYLIKIVLAYTANGHFLCSAEFWIMSIYLPFGIALFQANVVQLQSISEQQQNMLTSTSFRSRKDWRSLSKTTKTYIYIAIGMVVQLVITATLYATTPTLQGNWSSYGKITHAKGQGLCRKSYQWIPSAFWQLFWSWCFGPVILFQIRKIHDVHYWRLQILLSVLAGLPGSPLWLASLYSPAFKSINKRFVPPMWLAPGIFMMQFVTIFFPIYEAYRSKVDMRKTLTTIREWEERKSTGSDSDSPSGTAETRSKELGSKASLEKALTLNPQPLLEFAATQDFTAENILFLMRTRQWRANWLAAPRSESSVLTSSAASRLFTTAQSIYDDYVSEQTAEFPINIEHKIRRQLDALFARPTSSNASACSWSDDETVWSGQSPRVNSETETSSPSVSKGFDYFRKQSDVTAIEWHESDTDSAIILEPIPAESPLKTVDHVSAMEGIDERVFDAAVESIMYLVLTNTWQKFVSSRRHRMSES